MLSMLVIPSETVLLAAQSGVSEVARAVFIATPAVLLMSLILGLQRRGWL